MAIERPNLNLKSAREAHAPAPPAFGAPPSPYS